MAAARSSLGRRRVRLVEPGRAHAEAFLAAVRRSRALHHPWAEPPATRGAYDEWLERLRRDTHHGWLVTTPRGDLAGWVNLSGIEWGALSGAYLGYGALEPHAGRGYATAGVAAAITRAFRTHGLHRLEANIQPGNARSIALVRRLGFVREGFSERYLRLGGRWRDHERWAILRERWRG